MTADTQPDTALVAIRERLDSVTGFAAIERPEEGLTGRRTLAELSKDGETWEHWDLHSPYSWEALTFIVHAPADIRFLLDANAALTDALAASEQRRQVAESLLWWCMSLSGAMLVHFDGWKAERHGDTVTVLPVEQATAPADSG